MPNVNLAPLDAQQAAINRRRALALALQQQSMEPLPTPPVRGAMISPVEGIAKLAQALVGGLSNRRLDKEQAALSGQQQALRESQAGSLVQALTPPAQGDVITPDNSGLPLPQLGPGPQQLNPAPQQLDARAQSIKALAAALASQDPMMQKSGEAGLQNLMISGRDSSTQRAEMARLLAGQAGEDRRANQSAGLTQQQIDIQRQLANQKAVKPPVIVPADSSVYDPETASFNQAPKTIVPKAEPKPTEFDIKLQDFNKDPVLTKKYGTGSIGFEKWQQDMRVQAASAGAAARQSATDSTDPRLKNVDPKVQPVVLDKVQKAESALNAAKRAQDDMASVVESAKAGNKVSASYSPVLGVLEINTANGTKRINRNEIEIYAGAGSAFDRIAGWIGKGVSGQPIPKNVLDDMRGLSDILAKNAATFHDRELQSIDKTYRSTFGTAPAAAGMDLGATLDKLFGPAPKAK